MRKRHGPEGVVAKNKSGINHNGKSIMTGLR
jgi:hypothetical protein